MDEADHTSIWSAARLPVRETHGRLCVWLLGVRALLGAGVLEYKVSSTDICYSCSIMVDDTSLSSMDHLESVGPGYTCYGSLGLELHLVC